MDGWMIFWVYPKNKRKQKNWVYMKGKYSNDLVHHFKDTYT